MNQDTQKGFTIIEVLIVLAIAGLLLTLIMLTIPTLERNGRNNQRKQDVASILQAASRWGLNNSGAFPVATDKANLLKQAKLTFYADTNLQIGTSPVSRSETSYASVDPVQDVDKVIIFNYAKCGDNGGAIGRGSGYDDAVALFAVETRTGFKSQCQQL